MIALWRVIIPSGNEKEIQVGDLVVMLSPWKESLNITAVVTEVYENADINGIRRIYVALNGEARSWDAEYVRVISGVKKNKLFT